jgi:hypothetical protein
MDLDIGCYELIFAAWKSTLANWTRPMLDGTEIKLSKGCKHPGRSAGAPDGNSVPRAVKYHVSKQQRHILSVILEYVCQQKGDPRSLLVFEGPG